MVLTHVVPAAVRKEIVCLMLPDLTFSGSSTLRLLVLTLKMCATHLVWQVSDNE